MAVFLSAIGGADYLDHVVDSLGAAGFGILLTFVVLTVMIGILVLMHWLFALVEKKTAKRNGQPASEAQVEAAIVAAISEYRGDDSVQIKIKSIKKI